MADDGLCKINVGMMDIIGASLSFEGKQGVTPIERNKTTTDSQFIQQHLANERTFLAWVRTAIAVVGLGFLAAGVVFRTSEFAYVGHEIAAGIGVGSVIIGGLILTCATRDYFIKRTTINNGSFHSPGLTIWVMYLSLGLVDVFMVVLVLILLGF